MEFSTSFCGRYYSINTKNIFINVIIRRFAGSQYVPETDLLRMLMWPGWGQSFRWMSHMCIKTHLDNILYLRTAESPAVYFLCLKEFSLFMFYFWGIIFLIPGPDMRLRWQRLWFGQGKRLCVMWTATTSPSLHHHLNLHPRQLLHLSHRMSATSRWRSCPVGQPPDTKDLPPSPPPPLAVLALLLFLRIRTNQRQALGLPQTGLALHTTTPTGCKRHTGQILPSWLTSALRSSSSSSSCSSSLPPIPQYLTLPSRGSAFHKPGTGTKSRELEQYASQWQGRQGSVVIEVPKTDINQVTFIQIYPNHTNAPICT